jgi:hypothetical protein
MPPHRFHGDRTQTRKGGRYDGTHKKARAVAAKRHQPSDPCYRCGHPLGPMGSWLHLDHTDDGLAYGGFSHGSRPCPTCGRSCNLRAGAQVGNQRQAQALGYRHRPPLRW